MPPINPLPAAALHDIENNELIVIAIGLKSINMLAQTIIWRAGRGALYQVHRRAYASTAPTPEQIKIVQSTTAAYRGHCCKTQKARSS
jgi:hypothetical protein